MKLWRLECLCAVVSADYNLSRAARQLNTSQPTVSRQLQLLEQDLGFAVLVRRRNTIRGLTHRGRAAYERARRIVHESRQLARLGAHAGGNAPERLTVATTHLHARYTLLDPVKRLREQYPGTSISILTGSSSYIQQAVASGQADVGICVRHESLDPDLVAWPCFEIHRVIIAPTGHPLLGVRRPTLEDIARFPLITYDQGVSAGWRIVEAFTEHDLAPEIVLSAAGAEVIKAYVAAGVGIALIQKLAFDRHRDTGIRAMPADHLFAPVTAALMIRRGARLGAGGRDLALQLVPGLEVAELESHLLAP